MPDPHPPTRRDGEAPDTARGHDTGPGHDTARVGGNILTLGGGEILARLVALAATGYLTRTLGEDGFGVIGWATAVCGYLAFAVHAGFEDVGSREVARDPGRAPGMALGATLVRIAVAFVMLGVVGLVAWWIDEPPATKAVLVFTGFSFVSLALDTGWVYKGLESMRRVGVALVLRQLLYAGLVLALVRGGDDVSRVPLALFAAEAVVALWLAAPLLRAVRGRPDLARGRAMFGSSLPVVAVKLARTTILTFDVLVIEHLMTDADVGLYSAAYRFVLMLLLVAVSVHTSYRPAFTRAAVRGPQALGQVADRALHVASAVGMPLVAGSLVVAEPLLVLLFGPGFDAAATPFRLLLATIGLAFLTGALHNVFVVTDRLRPEVWIMGAAATLNVVLNLLLVPRLGLAGAAGATLAAQASILAMGLATVRRLGWPVRLGAAARPALAAAVMAAVLLALGWDDRLVLAIPAGGVAYVAALALLRGVPEDAPRFGAARRRE